MRRMRYWLAALCVASMLLANGCGTDTKAETESSAVSVAEKIENADKTEQTGSEENSGNAENTESVESVPEIEVESAYTVDLGEDLEEDFG